jgi:hypothetical protein
MALFCMVVPYLRLVLHASYLHVAVVLGCSFLIDYVCSLLFGCCARCKTPDKWSLGIQAFVSAVIMIGSLMALFTIHVWPDVNNGDLKIGIIVLAALFCSLALCAFGSFRSRFCLLLADPIGGSPAGFLGFSLGAAIWTGLLWFPIDFSTGAHWLFGLASIIILSFPCLSLLGFCCRSPDGSGFAPVLLASSTKDNGTSFFKAVQGFGCFMWISLFLVFLFNASITPMSYFLIDWETSCGNATCLQEFDLGLNDVNYPLRFYWYLSVASAAGYLVLSVLGGLLRGSYALELPMTIAALGIFDIALFAIGYTANRPWWIILLLVSQGFYLSSSWYIENHLPMLILSTDKGNGRSSSGDSIEHIHRLIDVLAFLGRMSGLLLIYFIVENSDYVTLFRILGVLMLLTGILVAALYIRIRLLESAAKNSFERISARPYMTKPLMIFKKTAKSA